MVSSYWVNFARTGDPNGKGLPEWPAFKDPDMGPHILGEIQDYPGDEVLNAYDAQYKQMLAKLNRDVGAEVERCSTRRGGPCRG